MGLLHREYDARFTINPKPQTLSPKSGGLNKIPKPQTLNPLGICWYVGVIRPSWRNPHPKAFFPEAVIPIPKTLHPRPRTRNPKSLHRCD